MADKLEVRFCANCGGKLEQFFGTQTNCPFCGHNLKTQFEDPEMAQLSDELDIGLEGLKGVKAERLEDEKARWELQKEQYLFHAQHGTKQCASCQEIVPAHSKFCLACGRSFS